MGMVKTSLGYCDICKGRNNVVYSKELDKYYCERINRVFENNDLHTICGDRKPLNQCSCGNKKEIVK